VEEEEGMEVNLRPARSSMKEVRDAVTPALAWKGRTLAPPACLT